MSCLPVICPPAPRLCQPCSAPLILSPPSAALAPSPPTPSPSPPPDVINRPLLPPDPPFLSPGLTYVPATSSAFSRVYDCVEPLSWPRVRLCGPKPWLRLPPHSSTSPPCHFSLASPMLPYVCRGGPGSYLSAVDPSVVFMRPAAHLAPPLPSPSYRRHLARQELVDWLVPVVSFHNRLFICTALHID
ncbi:hypothetical protein CRENBAI_006551 [Crenichthys baileyi]|uniref:Uncharacterized protein n=1 Tax=Crenichthys baileyi TaxID=28760 RepID=A0AAV9S1K2_9TELE